MHMRSSSSMNTPFIALDENCGCGTTDIPTSEMTHGAAPLAEQSGWLVRTPLTQQSVLPRLLAAPAVLHPVSPHWCRHAKQMVSVKRCV